MALSWSGINIDAVCSFNYSTSASAQGAWKAMGNDPSYLANPA